ncbi:hypothetical protein F5I97DRAFT_1345664 [Phlebopus sp. FC_14]|nr:hypothetical protein F5I97DRAFT_1345664 [Phlebopus sp. FC_14]
MNIVVKQLKITGVVVVALLPKYEEDFYKEIPALIATGELKFKEDITQGLEGAGEAILSVLQGTNDGKKIVVVAEE